jgi:hypothetical protein
VIAILFILKQRKNKSATQDPGISEMGDQNNARAEGKWFFGGRWRDEAHNEGMQNELDSNIVEIELDSTTVHIVPGPPAELDSTAVQVDTEHDMEHRATIDSPGHVTSHADSVTR